MERESPFAELSSFDGLDSALALFLLDGNGFETGVVNGMTIDFVPIICTVDVLFRCLPLAATCYTARSFFICTSRVQRRSPADPKTV